MGVPDGEEMLQPTQAQGWIHQMTCPRELRYRDSKLWGEAPVRELEMRERTATGGATPAMRRSLMPRALVRAERCLRETGFAGALPSRSMAMACV